jgi:hypothetical protein
MGFTRTKEDFICAHCGASVKGSGYTNHCPICLWSRHVDIEPGDRASACGGLMEPLALEGASPSYVIVHRCTRCGFERRNKVAGEDSEEALLALVRKRANS